MVPDNFVTDIVNKVLAGTGLGLAGEGKVFVSDVYEAVDIGTGSRGESAL